MGKYGIIMQGAYEAMMEKAWEDFAVAFIWVEDYRDQIRRWEDDGGATTNETNLITSQLNSD